MNPAEALKLIRARAAKSEQVVVLPHASTRMRERRIDFLDIVRCLQGGTIVEGPYVPVDSRDGAWRCNVEGIVTGRRLCVVVSLPCEPPDVFVVTVI